MRIVLVSDWFSEKMGYAENCLPKALAKMGHDVHVVTSNFQVYYNEKFYEDVYEPFIGPKTVPVEVKEFNSYRLHRLPVKFWWKRIHIIDGLIKEIKKINPDIIQSFEAISSTTFQLALLQPLLKYKLFTAVHTVASVYPAYYNFSQMSFKERLRLRLFDTIPGKIISITTSKCYGATIDASVIAHKFFGVNKKKVFTAPLGVDTDLFYPVRDDSSLNNRKELREKYEVSDKELLCIYSGRFVIDKNPLCLARAIDKLNNKGENFKGIFIGAGPQEEQIKKCSGCTVISFVPYYELPSLFRMSDIGVWPRQESTSMLDAAACGLPIVVSDKMLSTERRDGNGLTYKENDYNDLMIKLIKLLDSDLRKKLSKNGIQKMENKFSWNSIARKRITDYNLC